MSINLPTPKAVTPVPNVRHREFDKCGSILAGGQIWTYEANSTTPKVTYKDPYGLTPNTNPIALDANGEADIFLNGTYRFVVQDKKGVVQKDVARIGSWYSGDLDDQMKSVNDLLETSSQTLMQPLADAINTALAAGAGEAGWDSSLVADGNENQKTINNETIRNFDSITQLQGYIPRRNGQTVFVKSYHGGWAAVYPFLGPCGGGNFAFNASRLNENDGVLIFNGWERQVKGAKISVHDAGARGDYNTTTNTGTDDSPAIQRALKVSYSLGLRSNGQLGDRSFTVNCDGNRNYYVANHVLQPANVTLNGNGCTWYGNNKLNDGVHSGLWVNGNLIDHTVESPLETAHFFRTHIKNILFKKFKYSMSLRGFTFGCSIQDCSSLGCVSHLRSIEHYFLRVLRNKAESCDLAYFFDVFSGMVSFQTVSASDCKIGFYFANAAQAVKINNISVEGTGDIGIYIEGQGNTGGISIQHCYLEGKIKTAIEVSTNTWGSVTLGHNFVNIFGGTLAKDSANCKFIIEDNNFLQNVGTLLDTTTTMEDRSRTRQDSQKWSGGSLAPNSANGISYDKNKYYENRADFWTSNVHEQLIFQKNNASGHTQALHNHFFGLIPATYYGNQGSPDINIVPFCGHVGVDKTEGATPLLAINVTTSITVTPYMTGLFNFVIYHDNGTKSIFAGRFYGLEVTLDVYKTSGIVNPELAVTSSTINNVLVLNVGKLSGSFATGSYTCTGFIKLI